MDQAIVLCQSIRISRYFKQSLVQYWKPLFFTCLGPLVAIIGQLSGNIAQYIIIIAVFYIPHGRS